MTTLSHHIDATNDIAVTRQLAVAAPSPIFSITAFGKDVQVHADREALFAAHPETATDVFGDIVRLVGPETLHLVPLTTDGELQGSPDIYMTATVLTAKKRQNGITGVSHVQCLVQTSGSRFDVILAGDAKPAEVPKPGSILDGTFTLTGVLISKDSVVR